MTPSLLNTTATPGLDPTCCWTCEGRGWVDAPDDLCDDPSCDAAPGEEL